MGALMQFSRILCFFAAICFLFVSACSVEQSKTNILAKSPDFPELFYVDGEKFLCVVRFDISFQYVEDKRPIFAAVVNRFATVIIPEDAKLFKIDIFNQTRFFAVMDKPESGCSQVDVFFNEAMFHAVRGAGAQPMEEITPKSGDFEVPVVKWTSKIVTPQETDGGLALWSKEKNPEEHPASLHNANKFPKICSIKVRSPKNGAAMMDWINRVVGYYNTRTNFGILLLVPSIEETTLLFAGKCDNLEARTEAIIRWVSQVSGTEPPGPYTIERAG
jgi:hypothetical protein